MTDTPDAAPPRKAGLLARLLVPIAFVGGAIAGGAGAAVAVLRFAPPPASVAAAPPPPAPVEYVEFDTAFTSNLVDTGRYLQLRLTVSTTGGSAATGAIARHKPALVSAILGLLGECGEAQVADRAAKEKLRSRLRTVINETLRARGESARVEDVFFISLVVQ